MAGEDHPSEFSGRDGELKMTRMAVGFYWTLPVPWVGFERLSDQVDEAAEASRTIRYQRDLIRRYAAEHRYNLMHEQVFMEIGPDRGSDYIIEPLKKAQNVCLQSDAVLLYVEFSEKQRWRAHRPMADWLSNAKIRSEKVAPDPIKIDGSDFDPHAHFRAWRERQKDWMNNKPERIAKAKARSGELLEQGAKYSEIADILNDEQLRSATGCPWTAENIRKLTRATKSQS
jgi:hypothetical protein